MKQDVFWNLRDLIDEAFIDYNGDNLFNKFEILIEPIDVNSFS